MDFVPLTRIEEAALNAWPAPRQMLYDGWVLRFTGGNSKRVNSVNILGASTLPFDKKIQFCEAVYRSEGYPVLFRLPDLFTPSDLPQVLLEKGYVSFDPTLVLGWEIDARSAVPDGVVVRTFSDEDWLQIYAQVAGKRMAALVHHAAVLNAIVPKKNLVGLFKDDRPVACGMGVVSGNLLGYFSIYTHKTERRNGFGRWVMAALSRWGSLHGAKLGYLQVEGDNAPARAMYQKLRFTRLYGYVYWRKVGEEIKQVVF